MNLRFHFFSKTIQLRKRWKCEIRSTSRLGNKSRLFLRQYRWLNAGSRRQFESFVNRKRGRGGFPPAKLGGVLEAQMAQGVGVFRFQGDATQRFGHFD